MSAVVLVLIHLPYHDAMLDVIIINSTCKDKRNSGNYGISRDIPPSSEL